MNYRQDLSFIATLTSQTPGFDGFIDSVEYPSGAVAATRGNWLTLITESGISPQQFWFGCYEDGPRLRFEIKTFTLDQDPVRHHKTLALSHNQYVGLYDVKPANRALWRVRKPVGVFDTPEPGEHLGIKITTADYRPLGPSQKSVTRRVLDNCYVQVNERAFDLVLNIEKNNVPRFDSFASDVLPALYR